MTITKRMRLTDRPWASAILLLTLGWGSMSAYGQFLPSGNFNIELWPSGVVHYRFAEAGDVDPLNEAKTIAAAQVLDADYRDRVRAQMARWSFPVTDPADNSSRAYIRFVECANCPSSHVFIRKNFDSEGDQNMCSYRTPADDPRNSPRLEMPGRNPNGATILHFNGLQDTNTVLHELGHCVGLWHEFNREDSDAWLLKTADWTALGPESRAARYMPLLGNYDYDSLMHYGSRQNFGELSGVLMFRDRSENEFSRRQAERRTVSDHQEESISIGDRSRILQYYAREFQQNWGFFFSLNDTPQDSDALPDPHLARGVKAVGTPAIVHHQGNDFDLFIRGDDRNMYWRSFREEVRMVHNVPVLTYQRSAWTSVGCCFGSDPAAISRRVGEIDLFAVGAITGKLEQTKYRNRAWDHWQYIQGGYPYGGLKEAPDGYLGPAVASRGLNSMDVFVVRADGLLAVTTLNGNDWTVWHTLGRAYSVTARPAAVALSSDQVRLAVNESGTNLYEPLVSFSPNDSSVEQFSLGARTARFMSANTPPALTARNDAASPYRVLISNSDGRISHRFANGAWRDIGGTPLTGTGPAAVATGSFSAFLAINNQDAMSCNFSCCPASANPATGCSIQKSPRPNTLIQPGGLWMRIFQ